MNQVTFYSADKSIPIKGRRDKKIFFQNLFSREKYKLKKISFIFCSDDYLLGLNNRHLNHNFYTDVLTFSLSIDQQPIEGEVYMSIERIKENAKFFSEPYQNELLRVMIHGALHLCGYTDKLDAARALMREKENFYIQLYKLDSRET